MIRVLLADDQALVRAGFRLIVDSDPELEVAGEAADGEAAVSMAKALRPDVVLMDIRMPIVDGIAATRRIAADPVLNGIHVLILTTFESDEYVFKALRAGASGFVLKDIEPADLLRAIRVVAAGEALLAPSVTRRLISQFARRAEPKAADTALLAHLTDREREVVALVGGGKSNREIAQQLYVSEATIKTHVSRAMSKVYARDRAQLVVFAYESGLVVATTGW